MRYLKRYVTVLSLAVLIVVASFVFAGMLERLEQRRAAELGSHTEGKIPVWVSIPSQDDPFRGPAYNVPDAK